MFLKFEGILKLVQLDPSTLHIPECNVSNLKLVIKWWLHRTNKQQNDYSTMVGVIMTRRTYLKIPCFASDLPIPPVSVCYSAYPSCNSKCSFSLILAPYITILSSSFASINSPTTHSHRLIQDKKTWDLIWISFNIINI